MYRYLPLIALLAALGLNGCGRQSDTHDPANVEREAPGETATEAMEEPIAPPPDSGTVAGNEHATDAQICTPEWFAWVNEQIVTLQDGNLAELYPHDLPEVGSEEWFLAVDKLTGGDGAHGPDGGSAEWCSMIELRLNQHLNQSPKSLPAEPQ